MAQYGEAIYDLLSTNADLKAQHKGQVNAVRFAQGKALPGLNFNTRNMLPLPCRGKTSTREGQLEIGALAGSPLELASLVETVTETLHNYEGTHLGWHLQIELSDEEFDEHAPELTGFFKALLFDLVATKLA